MLIETALVVGDQNKILEAELGGVEPIELFLEGLPLTAAAERLAEISGTKPRLKFPCTAQCDHEGWTAPW